MSSWISPSTSDFEKLVTACAVSGMRASLTDGGPGAAPQVLGPACVTTDVPSLRLTLPAIAVAAVLALPAAAPAVVGGGPATPGLHPHMAALQQDGRFICGGSLVAPDIVLTAAHCVAGGKDGAPTPAGRLSLLLGTYDRSRPQTGETIAVTQVMRHESFGDPEAFSHDVALLRLSRAATKATPIAIVTPAERALWAPGAETIVTGWGTAAPFDLIGATVRDDLQEVGVPIVADRTCAATNFEPRFEPKTLVCAGNLQGAEDACQGDSGGPLTAPGAAGGRVLVGVVSSGLGCGLPTQYGQYARIGDAPLQDWLRARLPAAGTATAGPQTSPATGSDSGSGSGSGSPAAGPGQPPAAGSGSGAVPTSGSASSSTSTTRRTTLRVRSASRRSRRVTVRLASSRVLRDVTVSVQRVRRGRTSTVARRRLARTTRTQLLRVTVGPRAARSSTLRLRVSGRDAAGRRVSAVAPIRRAR
jgi:secreted trypsin-like serine protease